MDRLIAVVLELYAVTGADADIGGAENAGVVKNRVKAGLAGGAGPVVKPSLIKTNKIGAVAAEIDQGAAE